MRLHCPLSAAVGHLKQLEEQEKREQARLTFAPAQAALLAKSQIAAQQNGDCVHGEGGIKMAAAHAGAKWRIVCAAS